MITITHPDKILFPDSGITKGELAAYYEMIAPSMVPHMRARPVTMERYHRGIGAPGFFQKDVSKGFPEWLQRVEVPKKGGTVHHPLVTDARSLLWLANQNCITPHVWTSRVPALFYPDICVFDPATVGTGPTRRVRDFPADAERLTAEEPTGMRHVLVNGTPIRENGMQIDTFDQRPGMRPEIN